MSLPTGLRRAVERAMGTNILAVRAVGGGSLHQTWSVRFTGGLEAFLKSAAHSPAGIFARESEGLEALGRLGALRVPRVLAVGEEGEPFLLLELIREGRRDDEFLHSFGRALARLHLAARGERYGYDRDGFLGTTPQPNAWSDSWTEFWRRHRLGFQLELARRRGLSTPELDRLGELVLDRLDALIGGPNEPPTLIHGDLWGGNYLCDEHGEAVLVDPAAYYGRREAELAMTRLFGGFGAAFERGYEEVWPLEPGADKRIALYQSYHLLNHLNLFGRGYLEQCLASLRSLI